MSKSIEYGAACDPEKWGRELDLVFRDAPRWQSAALAIFRDNAGSTPTPLWLDVALASVAVAKVIFPPLPGEEFVE